MPTPTYTSLGTITLTSTDSEIIFSNIGAGYRDLIVVIGGKTTGNADIGIRLNSDSGSNYSFVYMGGNGSSPASGAAGSQTNVVLDAYFWRSSEESTCIAQIMDYSATDKHKTVLSRNNVAGGGVDAFANRWANTAAVNTVTVRTTVNAFAIGSVISIYGVN